MVLAALAVLAGCDAAEPRWVHLSELAAAPDADPPALVLGDLAAHGRTLAPGQRWSVTTALPPDAALRFGVAAWAPFGAARPSAQVRFRVALDGRTLFDEVLEVAAQELRETHHVLALPSAGAAAAELEFACEGAPLASAFLDPCVGPLAIGRPGARPWPERRPDVVLLVADTFRADLLAEWGGPVFGTPHLNALAARGTRFLAARSVATWTLPAMTSLLTGFFPTQHGALEDQRASGAALETLAQRLRAAGYRTGAVTDAGYVSRAYGLERGFEWFREHPGLAQQRIARTLEDARAFLARDDGRPTFLLVHTYRTHWPYRTGADESPARHAALVADFQRALGPGRQAEPALLEPFARALLELYRRAASDLDTALGPWLAELEASGFLEHGLLVFTSDHGEAFFEHGKSEHRGLPFEEEIRVPLFVVGRGVPARAERAPVSALDLVPSLAEACGLAPDARWAGRAWSTLAPERACFAWHGEEGGGALAVVRGTHKLFAAPSSAALARGAARAAFDLERDPLEHADQVRAGAAWPAELARAVAGAFAAWETPLAPPRVLELEPARARELEALGYGAR